MKFTIYGEPIAKMRPRFFVRGRHVGCYDLQEKEKKQVQREIIAQLHEAMNSPYKEIALESAAMANSCSFSVQMRFYMAVPKSWERRAVNSSLWNWNRHNKKPDCDNLIKFYADILNGILYYDDAMVVHITAEKLYSETPRTEITIMANDDLTYNQTREVIVHFSPEELYQFYKESTYLHEALKLLHWEQLEDSCTEENYKAVASNIFDFSKKYAPVMTKISKLKFEEKS